MESRSKLKELIDNSPTTDDYKMYQYHLNARDRSNVSSLKSSTPFQRLKNVRQSLGKIRKNTVSGMVKVFTHQKKLIKTDSPSEVDRKLSLFGDDKSVVSDQISYFNEISSINQASVDSELNSVDSGDDFISARRRSKTFNASGIKNQSSHIIGKYSKYPNFKWRYLKYFGEDPKQYLSSLNVDLDSISEISTSLRTRNGNRGVEEFDSMRKRSQSFNAGKLMRASIKQPEEQESNLKLVDKNVESLDVEEITLKSSGKKCPITGCNDELKSRIQKSIDSYENILKNSSRNHVRGENTTSIVSAVK